MAVLENDVARSLGRRRGAFGIDRAGVEAECHDHALRDLVAAEALRSGQVPCTRSITSGEEGNAPKRLGELRRSRRLTQLIDESRGWLVASSA